MSDPDDTLTGLDRIERVPDASPEMQRLLVRLQQTDRQLGRRMELAEHAVREVFDKELPSLAKAAALSTLRQRLEDEIKARRAFERRVYGFLVALVLAVVGAAVDRLLK